MKSVRKSKNVLALMLLILMLAMLIGCGENEEKVNNEVTNSGNNQIQDNIENSKNNFIEKTVQIEGTKKVGDIEISNIQIKLVEKDKCEVTAKVKNTSDKDLEPTNVEIRVVNEKGETEEIFGGIITELIWYEENEFTTYVLADITDAYDLEFEAIESK